MANNINGYLSNPQLKTLKAPEGWEGTPIDQKGRFLNLNHPFTPSLMDVLRWKVQKSPFSEAKKAEVWNPIIYKDDSWIKSNEDIIVWMGHSTFYFRINGIQILVDPVFFDILSIKRRSEFPINIDQLVNLDYILLSHDHRDHLDEKSLKILSAQNPEVQYLSGLDMKDIIHRFTGSHKIEEAGWYQQYSTSKLPINVAFVPSRHWSKRGLNDTNKRLWGGFIIETPGVRILFGGDSGYDTHYKQFASLYGYFNYAILGIGAYEPAWFMSANHQSPASAFKAFKELNADHFIPMHYGTFDLSDEPLSQPLKDLKASAKGDECEERLKILEIGQSLTISKR